jgi:hypothetical protein
MRQTGFVFKLNQIIGLLIRKFSALIRKGKHQSVIMKLAKTTQANGGNDAVSALCFIARE